MHRLYAAAASALLIALAGHAAEARDDTQALRIDSAHSVAQFTVTKLGFADVTGIFRESWGEIRWSPAHPEASSIRWRVRVASVQTDAANRDSALQGRDYFDAERHPELTFESTAVRARDGNTLEVAGMLTMRGTTRPVTVDVRHSGPQAAPIFETSFEIDRYDYGIVGGTVMRRLIGRAVRIHLRAVTERTTS